MSTASDLPAEGKLTGKLAIRGARVIDPAQNLDTVTDLCIADGKLVAIGDAGFQAEREIDARGLVACPGLVDISVSLKKPGAEHSRGMIRELSAAAAGGVTHVVCPPDTFPIADSTAVVRQMHETASAARRSWVWVIGAMTQGLGGEQLADMAALKQAGCVAVSNRRRPLASNQVLRRALEYAATFDLAVVFHPEDADLAGGGCAHEGSIATRLGLPGIPAMAETVAVARDLELVAHTGVRAHFAHLSTAGAVRMIADARRSGVKVTADVAVHQLLLTEDAIEGFNALAHVRPPLRTLRDREALRQAVADGVVDAVCSDHQPCESADKLAPFPSSRPGISGTETLLPLTLRLVSEGVMTLPQAIAALSFRAAGCFGIAGGSLRVNERADLCLFDPAADYTLAADGPDAMVSAGRNTPFLGEQLTGRVLFTLLGNRVLHSRRSQNQSE
ncbi:MAG: dihydroorotase [Pseudomonadota bacterium]